MHTMNRPPIWLAACLLAGAAVLSLNSPARAGGHGKRGSCPNCRPVQYGQPDLFYNYYVPGTCGGVPAAMYLAPHPVPPLMGHTYITYQPFMPHEMLYTHHRSYYRYYDGGRGMTRVNVRWYRPPSVTTLHAIKHPFRIAR